MMRLHSIEIHNVRGVEHLRVDELPETGVVVIHGENEAGKSTVARLLKEQGWTVVDADQLARDIVEPGEPALTELAEAFGADQNHTTKLQNLS